MKFRHLKIILDSNIWISFAIGKRISDLEYIFNNPHIRIFVCDKLLREVSITLQRPKLQKYVSDERHNTLMELMISCSKVSIKERVVRSRDAKDNFLLDLAEITDANFLITGDNDLIVLEKNLDAEIVSFNRFMDILL